MLEIKNVYKTYTSNNGVSCRALENVSLKFPTTGLCFILGKSGSGKSTLLNLIGGLDNFDRGEITYNGQDFSKFSKDDFEYYRNMCVGFVFQDFCLLDNLTALENVKLALSLQRKSDNKACLEALKKVGVENLKNRKINELTGGQKQRIAIARAIVKKAKIILADEPTGSLDSDSSNDIMNLLASLAKDSLVIIVTHNKELANQYAKRIIEIQDGFILKDMAIKEDNKDDVAKNMMYSSSLMYLPKGNQINEAEVNELNTIMQEKRQDYYFLVEQNKERIASMYPNMKEVFFPSRKEEKFIPYRYVDAGANGEKLNKSSKSMSYHDSLKFGASLTKKRFGKLFLSIIITIITIVIMGVISNYANYNLEEAISVSLKNNNDTSLNITSSFSVSDENYKIQEKDLLMLDSYGYEYAKKYDIATAFSSSTGFNLSNARKDALFNGSFAGFIETDNVEKLGYKYLYQATNPDVSTGVNISSVVASTLVYYNLANSMEELIDREVTINYNKYKIIGIFDTDNETYDQIRYLKGSAYDNLLNKYNNIKNEVILRLVVDSSFIDNYIDNFTRYNSTIIGYTSNLNNASINFNNSFDITKDYPTYPALENDGVVFFDSDWNLSNFESKITTMKENEIFVGNRAFFSLLNLNFDTNNLTEMKEKVKEFNAGNHSLTLKAKSTSSLNETYYTIENVQIVGAFAATSQKYRLSLFLNHDLFTKTTTAYFKPSSVELYLNSSIDYELLVTNLYNNGFVINSSMVDYLVALVNQINSFKTLLDIGLIIWLVIVALLFYSFMSKSIQDNKRQIGILKALGANGKDIYKIFTYEALLLALFAILGGALIYVAMAYIVDGIITTGLSFYYPMFIVNSKIILTMVLPTLLVLIASLIIPISKANNIKPIEVMNRE